MRAIPSASPGEGASGALCRCGTEADRPDGDRTRSGRIGRFCRYSAVSVLALAVIAPFVLLLYVLGSEAFRHYGPGGTAVALFVSAIIVGEAYDIMGNIGVYEKVGRWATGGQARRRR